VGTVRRAIAGSDARHPGSGRHRKFARGEVVFHEGDRGDTLHLIARGHLAVRVTTPLGDTATVRILGPGEYFGELAVVAPAPGIATVTALDATETVALHRDQIERLRQEHPDVDRVLLEAVVGEVRRSSAALLEAMYVPVPARLARALVGLARTYPGDRQNRAVIPLTQDTSLASRTTSSRAACTRPARASPGPESWRSNPPGRRRATSTYGLLVPPVPCCPHRGRTPQPAPGCLSGSGLPAQLTCLSPTRIPVTPTPKRSSDQARQRRRVETTVTTAMSAPLIVRLGRSAVCLGRIRGVRSSTNRLARNCGPGRRPSPQEVGPPGTGGADR
jgi:CRP/FNR family transcriptional regulator, cyclic AMP receptor protein